MRLRYAHLILIGLTAVALTHLTPIPHFAVPLSILMPLVLLTVFGFARLDDHAAQQRIRDEFKKALAAGDTGAAIPIGGVLWTASNGGLFMPKRSGDGFEPIPDHYTGWETRKNSEENHAVYRILLAALFALTSTLTIWTNLDPSEVAAGIAGSTGRMVLDLAIAANLLVAAWEIAYRQGRQNILGAMVLDPMVGRPGAKAVQEQKAHGDARLATEEEAREAATGKAVRRSKVNRLAFVGQALADAPDVEQRLVDDDTSAPQHNEEPNYNIYLGRHYDPENDEPRSELLYRGDRHLLIFGPTGSGKGRRFLIPNLLYGLKEQSVIVIDPKGEAAALTADARRKMGHEVVILNPFDVRGSGSAGFNPLAFLNPDSPNFYDDASAIGEALVKIEDKDPHWSQSAQGLVVALMMWEKLRNGDDANLANVRAMLTEADDWDYEKGGGANPKQVQIAGFRVTIGRMIDSGSEVIASLAARFAATTNEIENIKSTADTQTRWILSGPMSDDLRKDGINFASLKDRPTTVYLILPAERLRTHSAWLRLVIVSALRSLYQPGGRRVLMLIDEMAALGHLAPLEDAFALVRGYGVQIAAIFQDLGQLKELYKERWETFIANAGVVLGFAPNDLTTADWMSKRSGQTTVVAKATTQNMGTSSGDKSSSSSEGSGISDQQIGRHLLLSHQLFGFDQGMGVLWLAGLDHTVRFFAPDYAMIENRRRHENSAN